MIEVLNSSARTRALLLTFLYSIGLGAASFGICFYAYCQVRKAGLEQIDTGLFNLQVDIATGDSGLDSFQWKIDKDGEAKLYPFHLGKALLDIRTLDGTRLLNSRALRESSLPVEQALMERAAKNKTAFGWVDQNGTTYRTISAKIGETHDQKPVMLNIAVVPERLVESATLWSFGLIPAILFISFGAGIHAGLTWNRRSKTA